MYPWRRILIPTDFSTAAEWVFDAAARVAASTGAELLVLHVRMTWSGQPDELRFPADPSLYEYAEQHELDLLRARLDQLHADVQSRLVVRQAPDAGEEISRTAEAEDADLVVIATHARHHVAHLLVGSTTLSVLRNPSRPVLAIRYGIRKREQMRRLVVPVHARQPGDAAATLAGQIAAHGGGEVHLITVCGQNERAGAEKLLADAAQRSLGGLPARRVVIQGSDIEREILRYTRENDADAIFLNADAALTDRKIDIIRHSTVPVMIVP